MPQAVLAAALLVVAAGPCLADARHRELDIAPIKDDVYLAISLLQERQETSPAVYVFDSAEALADALDFQTDEYERSQRLPQQQAQVETMHARHARLVEALQKRVDFETERLVLMRFVSAGPPNDRYTFETQVKGDRVKFIATVITPDLEARAMRATRTTRLFAIPRGAETVVAHRSERDVVAEQTAVRPGYEKRSWRIDIAPEVAALSAFQLDYKHEVLTVALSSNERWLAATGSDERVYLWDTESGRRVGVFPLPFSRIPGFFHRSDRYYALAGIHMIVATPPNERGAQMTTRELTVPSGWYHAYNDTQGVLAVVPTEGAKPREAVEFYRLTDESLELIAAHGLGGRVVGMTTAGKDGRVAAVTVPGARAQLEWFDPVTGKPAEIVKLGPDVDQTRWWSHNVTAYTHAAVSPDGRFVATGQGALRLFDARTGALLRQLDGNALHVGFSRDGNILAAKTDHKTLTLYATTDFKPIRKIDMRTHLSSNLTFSRDSKTLIYADGSGVVFMIDVQTGEHRAPKGFKPVGLRHPDRPTDRPAARPARAASAPGLHRAPCTPGTPR